MRAEGRPVDTCRRTPSDPGSVVVAAARCTVERGLLTAAAGGVPVAPGRRAVITGTRPIVLGRTPVGRGSGQQLSERAQVRAHVVGLEARPHELDVELVDVVQDPLEDLRELRLGRKEVADPAQGSLVTGELLVLDERIDLARTLAASR